VRPLEVLDRQNWEREWQIEGALRLDVAVGLRLDCCRFRWCLGVVVLRVFVLIVFLGLV
jgi:hypothetical protein